MTRGHYSHFASMVLRRARLQCRALRALNSPVPTVSNATAPYTHTLPLRYKTAVSDIYFVCLEDASFVGCSGSRVGHSFRVMRWINGAQMMEMRREKGMVKRDSENLRYLLIPGFSAWK